MDGSTHMHYEFLNIATEQCLEVPVGCQVNAVLEEIRQTHILAL
jgi:hypothetical protein